LPDEWSGYSTALKNQNFIKIAMKIIDELSRLLHFFRLDAELENTDVIHEEIKKGIIFKGTNLWVLMFAIIIASVGLNMNSTAVIIGAMLISPLMGPINGMGYSIATYNFELLRQSVKNFSFAVIAGLFASTVYFALSPISTAHSELLARTSPTIYDVIIALFGGLAGILAISSRLKGNVIPGVAIATALMPPLCTAGYGLATLQFSFFFGALYLFTINTIFIAFAAVWVSQILKFPIRSSIDDLRKKKINRMITAVITVVLLPSIYFGYQLIEQEKFMQSATLYVSNVRIFEGNYLLKYDIDATKRSIILVYGGNLITESQRDAIISKTEDFNIGKAHVEVEQGLTFRDLDEKTGEVFRLKEQISELYIALDHRGSQLDSIRQREVFGKVILNEINTLYPQIAGSAYSDTYIFHDTLSQPLKAAVVILSLNDELTEADKTRIKTWLMRRLNNQHLRVIYEKNFIQALQTTPESDSIQLMR
jgi:uncharacterized hydrophobic protein (TIGR00271 family)